MGKNTPAIMRIFLREVAMVPKDHSLLLTLLIAPLLYAFFYGSIYINKEEGNVKLALVDDDNTSLSRLLAQNVNNSPMVEIIRFSNLGMQNNSYIKVSARVIFISLQGSKIIYFPLNKPMLSWR